MKRLKRQSRISLRACPDCQAEHVPFFECNDPVARKKGRAVPRIVLVILVCALIALFVNLFLPLPHPWGLLLNVCLGVWVVLELLKLAGYSLPRG